MRPAHVDRTLAGIVAVLVVGGVMIFLSASLGLLAKGGNEFISAVVSQVVLGLGGGTAALYLALHTPLPLLKRFAPHVFVGALLLTLAVFLPYVGLSINGARRWLDFGFITFQPSEFLKIGYILFVATILAGGKDRASSFKEGIIPFAVVTGLVGVAMLLQPDTDTFLIIAASGAAMMFAAGLRYRDLGIIFLIAVVLVGGLVMVRPYLLSRVMTFVDPSRDPLGAGYQIQQSLIAVGSGDLFGRGYGQSIQKFNYLPEADSDSIFAVYSEEFGFVGSTILVFGFLFFALRGMWVSARAKDLFSGLLALGIVSVIALQSFLNMVAMLGIAPVGGLPLPFISHGGSALLITLGMVGLLLNVSKKVRA